MTIVLELRPEQEQRLQETAAAQGLTLEAYLMKLADGADSGAPLRSQQDREEWGRQFLAATRSLTPAPRSPPLSELRREYAYEDPEGED